MTLAMLAHAFLVVAARLQRIHHPPPPELIPLTCSGVSHLFVGLAARPLGHLVRRLLAARGESLRLLPSWGGRFGVELAGEVLLPGPDAQIAPTTFETWPAAQAQPADTSRSSTGSTDSGPG